MTDTSNVCNGCLQVLCKASYFVQAMSYTASVCILTVISLERFVAIIYPIHSRRLHSMLLLRATIVGVWTLAAVSGLPYVYVYDTVGVVDQADGAIFQFCVILHPFNIRAYTCATFVLWYLVPLAMMAFVYSRISVVLWRSSHGPRVTSAPPRSSPALRHDAAREQSAGGHASPVTRDNVAADSSDPTAHAAATSSSSSAGGRLLSRLGVKQQHCQEQLASPHCLITVEPSSDDAAAHGSAIELRSLTSGRETRRTPSALTANTDQSALSARRKVIRLLIAVVVSFAVCVLPYHVRVLWQAFGRPQLTDWHLIIPPITFVFYYLNSGLNPLLYALLSNNFRSSLSDVMCCRCTATTQLARATYDTRGGHVTMNTRTVRIASVN